MTDSDLLAALVRSRDADALGEIVNRYAGLVHASAQRQVDPGAADDVTQAVFLLLWQKPWKVRNPSALAGWLLKTTSFISRQWRRAEARRRRREFIAASTHAQIAGDSMTTAVHPAMPDHPLSSLLDDAVAQLGDADRSVVAMHYLQEKPLAEVAEMFGISHEAARKRASRALARLRNIFAKRGAEMGAGALSAALAGHGYSSAATSLFRDQIVRSILSGGSPASVSLVRSAARSAAATSAALIAIVLLVPAIAVSSLLMTTHRTREAPTIPPVAAPIAPKLIVANPIRVGIVLSRTTAGSLGPDLKPRGYVKQLRIAAELTAADIELIPVIERGTDGDPAGAAGIRQVFAGRQPIRAEDPAALKALDVVAVAEISETTPNVMAGVDNAVGAGVGLFNTDGFGIGSRGLNQANAAIDHLSGYSEFQYGYTVNAFPCDVLTNHPILGQLFSVPDLQLRPMGLAGVLPPGAIPLIRVHDMARFSRENRPSPMPPSYVIYPLFVTSYGKGRIVCCNFAVYGDVPSTLKGSGRAEFFQRCIRWLANRPLK
jgi:RNA polymerase sigma-70 factor (ECF subfamily)